MLRPWSMGLYWEDLGQCTIKLFLRERCSLRLASAWVILMASAVPKTALNATIKVVAMVYRLCDR